MQIQDGKGTGYLARVNSENQIHTYSEIETEIQHTSEEEGQAYIWTMASALAADKNLLWLRNDNTTDPLIIDSIMVGCDDATGLVEIWTGTGNTAGGATVTGVNLNRGSNNAALATGKSLNTNVDGGTGMTLLLSAQVPAGASLQIQTHGLILGYRDEVAINIVTDILLPTATIVGYYHKNK